MALSCFFYTYIWSNRCVFVIKWLYLCETFAVAILYDLNILFKDNSNKFCTFVVKN